MYGAHLYVDTRRTIMAEASMGDVMVAGLAGLVIGLAIVVLVLTWLDRK